MVTLLLICLFISHNIFHLFNWVADMSEYATEGKPRDLEASIYIPLQIHIHHRHYTPIL